MGPAIYKPGQGYWTRTMSAVGFSLIALMGGLWAGDQAAALRLGDIEPIYIRYAAFILVMAVSGLLIYQYIGRRPKTVEFMIATEGEMKKVNWSTRREVFGMTWVVIGFTVLFSIILTILDYLVLGQFFQWIRVIETS